MCSLWDDGVHNYCHCFEWYCIVTAKIIICGKFATLENGVPKKQRPTTQIVLYQNFRLLVCPIIITATEPFGMIGLNNLEEMPSEYS